SDKVMVGRCRPNAPSTARPLASVVMNSLSSGAPLLCCCCCVMTRPVDSIWSLAETGRHTNVCSNIERRPVCQSIHDENPAHPQGEDAQMTCHDTSATRRHQIDQIG